MRAKKDYQSLGNLYEQGVLLNEANPGKIQFKPGTAMGELGGDVDGTPIEDLPPKGTPFAKKTMEPVKFPGEKEQRAGKYYLPYITYFKQNYGPGEATQMAGMLARLAKYKIEQDFGGTFEGTDVEFRDQVLVPLIQEVVGEFGVSKGDNKITSGYVARLLFQALKEEGLVSIEKGAGGGKGSKGGEGKSAPSDDDWAD